MTDWPVLRHCTHARVWCAASLLLIDDITSTPCASVQCAQAQQGVAASCWCCSSVHASWRVVRAVRAATTSCCHSIYRRFLISPWLVWLKCLTGSAVCCRSICLCVITPTSADGHSRVCSHVGGVSAIGRHAGFWQAVTLYLAHTAAAGWCPDAVLSQSQHASPHHTTQHSPSAPCHFCHHLLRGGTGVGPVVMSLTILPSLFSFCFGMGLSPC